MLDMNAQRSASGIFYAVLSSATFGLIPLFSIPLLGVGIGSSTILFYRFALAATFMAMVMLVGGYSFVIRREVVGRVLLLSVLYAATAIGPSNSGANLEVRKIAVGPSAPPMIPIDAACAALKPKMGISACTTMKVAKIPI